MGYFFVDTSLGKVGLLCWIRFIITLLGKIIITTPLGNIYTYKCLLELEAIRVVVCIFIDTHLGKV